MVEHDPDVIKAADHVVDVGPFAGTRGGTIVFEGSFEDLLKADTLTGTPHETIHAAQDRVFARPRANCRSRKPRPTTCRTSAWIYPKES